MPSANLQTVPRSVRIQNVDHVIFPCNKNVSFVIDSTLECKAELNNAKILTFIFLQMLDVVSVLLGDALFTQANIHVDILSFRSVFVFKQLRKFERLFYVLSLSYKLQILIRPLPPLSGKKLCFSFNISS